MKVQQIGVQNYPTLLLQKGDDFIGFGGGVMTTEKLEARLEMVIKELNKEKIVEPPVGIACDIDKGKC